MKNLILTLAIVLSTICASSQNLLSTTPLDINTELVELTRDSINKLMRSFQKGGNPIGFQVESTTYRTSALSRSEIIDILNTRDLEIYDRDLGRFGISVAVHSKDPNNITTISKVYYAIYDNPYGDEKTAISIIVPKSEYSSYLNN
jgi:hypothetical protein